MSVITNNATGSLGLNEFSTYVNVSSPPPPGMYSTGGYSYVDIHGNQFARDEDGNFVYTGPSPYVNTTINTNPGKSMRNRITSVRVKAGYLGQVVVDDLTGTILWESSPKKTLAKAEKAAKKAQLRAAQRSFE